MNYTGFNNLTRQWGTNYWIKRKNTILGEQNNQQISAFENEKKKFTLNLEGTNIARVLKLP